jgi:malate dehydrogenase (oxaloacetate-decarboxylating)(NADP+)
MAEDLDQMALDYHRNPVPGKISVTATKRLANQRDLSLAYSPGVAAACRLIVEDANEAASMTARGNLVGVISNGTAVLGLGAIGPLASKPVMEGKAVLFKEFAGIDVFDIEVAETDPDRLVDIIAALEPTFGGINLEDIKAPECFIVEKKCRERMNIPVFHDDQHGTAICVAAAVYNGLKVVEKDIAEVRLACSGAGAAALACLDQLVSLGLDPGNILVSDIAGVVYQGRTEEMDPYKARYARETPHRSLADAIAGADIFLGLSAPGIVTRDMVASMAARPIILALANPTPEIMPEEIKAARDDAVIATGRSDYPNQVNNVLCFPFLFRGALDVGASTINEEMKLACVRAIAEIATQEASDLVARAYGGEHSLSFGPDYLIPKPFDPRLIGKIAPAVAEAAMASGVAARPLGDLDAYKARMAQFVYRTGFAMKPMFDRAKDRPMRVIYAEGEAERVLRAVQVIVDDGLAAPILVGRRQAIVERIDRFGLRIRPDEDVEILDPNDNPDHQTYWTRYLELTGRKGVSPELARDQVRNNPTVASAMAIALDRADAMICGVYGRFQRHLERVRAIVGLRDGVRDPSTLQMVVMSAGTLFIADTHVSYDPSAEELAEMAILAADEVRRFGIAPRVAFLSHSNFGSSNQPSAVKMRTAFELARQLDPNLEVEGEMRADTALSTTIRRMSLPDAQLSANANLVIMPNLDAANIGYNLVKQLSDGMSVGPILIGMNRSAHIVTPAISVRGLVNMTAVAVADAQDHADGLMPVGPLLLDRDTG